jgi:hypothetical protein
VRAAAGDAVRIHRSPQWVAARIPMRIPTTMSAREASRDTRSPVA